MYVAFVTLLAIFSLLCVTKLICILCDLDIINIKLFDNVALYLSCLLGCGWVRSALFGKCWVGLDWVVEKVGLVKQIGPMSISVICALVVICKITPSKRLLHIVLHLQCAFTLMATAAFCVTWILLTLNCSIMLHWTQPNPTQPNPSAFSALTLLVGRQEGHSAWIKKNWVVGCWRGCLPGARCRLAYGPSDATATHCLLLQ